MEFRTAIVDELGDVVCWCEDLTEDNIEEILDTHPEWSRRCVN